MADPVSPSSEKPNQPVAETVAPGVAAKAETPAPTQSVAEKLYPKSETPTETPPADPAKAAETKPVEAAKPEEKPAAPKVPEKYEVKAPEGVTLNEGLIESLTPTFKAAGLTNEHVQAIATEFINSQSKILEAQNAANLAAVQKDPELGGEKWADTARSVTRALQWGTTPQERQLLDQLGLGNHPGLVRMFKRIGDSLADDKPATGNPESVPQKTTAQRLYGKRVN